MPFWLTAVWWLGLTIVQALLTNPKIENARPSGLDEFQVPTATEGRVVPLIVGKVKMAAPNVIWYGDLQTQQISEKVGGFLGIGGKRVTKGFQYRLGVQMAVSRGPIDGVDRIWMADKVIKSGESTGEHSTVIDDADFFGGEDQGGGIQFTLDFLPGSRTQAAHPYISQFQDPAPAYRSTAYMVLYDGSTGPGYIGDQPTLRNMAYEPFWYPNSLAVTGGAERIGDDANPICFLYEILVNNDDWGLQIPGTKVQVTGTAAQGALRQLAEDIAAEGLGFSMVIDREFEARELIKEIERHVDGAFRLDLTDGRFKIILARPPTGPVPVLDESNIRELRNFSRRNWADTKNELRIGYTDRAKEYSQTYAFEFDNANRDINAGERNIVTLNFPGLKTAAVAAKFAARELPGFSFPVGKMTVLVDRSMYALQKGDAFDWTWPDYGITTLAMRVVKIEYDEDDNGEILVDAVEDIFRLETAGFVDPPGTLFVPPPTEPTPVLDAKLWQPPAVLAPRDVVGSFDTVRSVAVLASRNGQQHTGYEIWADLAGGTNFVLTNTTTDWTPSAQLDGALPDSRDTLAIVRIDSFVDVTLSEAQGWASSTFDVQNPSNLILIDDELMWFDGVADNGDGTWNLLNVRRITLGTLEAPHPDDSRVWFVAQGSGRVSPDELDPAPVSINLKPLPATASGIVPIGDATAISIVTVPTDGYGFNYGFNYGQN